MNGDVVNVSLLTMFCMKLSPQILRRVMSKQWKARQALLECLQSPVSTLSNSDFNIGTNKEPTPSGVPNGQQATIWAEGGRRHPDWWWSFLFTDISGPS